VAESALRCPKETSSDLVRRRSRPGINSVLGAATIRACLSGVEVLGIQDGFSGLMEGTSTTSPRCRSPTRAASTSGAAPTSASRARTRRRIRRTSTSRSPRSTASGSTSSSPSAATTRPTAPTAGHRFARRAPRRPCPKTIDNDLDLRTTSAPSLQTARDWGRDRPQLMVDAKTTSRWYFVIAMGESGTPRARDREGGRRDAHAHPGGVHRRARAFEDDRGHAGGAIVKRLAYGRAGRGGVLAEGLVEILPRAISRSSRSSSATRTITSGSRR